MGSLTPYLPRFTLRRALIAIALLALFLGWLRPDRAEIILARNFRGIELRPLWPNRTFILGWFEPQSQRNWLGSTIEDPEEN